MRAPFGVVIITGASSGLGAALANAYAGPRDHARPARARSATARRDGARLRGEGGDGERCRDRRDRGLRHGIMAASISIVGIAVDLLIANAGTSAGPDPDSPSEGVEAVARQVAVNLLGAINTVEPLLPAMCARGRGRVAVVCVDRGLSRASLQPGLLREQSGAAGLRRSASPAPGAPRDRHDRRLSGVLRFADDRPLRRADPVSAQQRRAPPASSSAASIAAGGASLFRGRSCSVCNSATSRLRSSAMRSCAATASRSIRRAMSEALHIAVGGVLGARPPG